MTVGAGVGKTGRIGRIVALIIGRDRDLRPIKREGRCGYQHPAQLRRSPRGDAPGGGRRGDDHGGGCGRGKGTLWLGLDDHLVGCVGGDSVKGHRAG